MGNVKIHEIAKKIGVSSKEVLDKALEIGLDVKTHLSNVSEEDAKKIEDKFSGTKKDKKDKNNAPVIIRREVIVNEQETLNKVEELKKNNTNNNRNVGFVERQRKTDYNIVYREKQKKPLTVSELFGKKETPKKQVEEDIKKEEKELATNVSEEMKTPKQDDNKGTTNNKETTSGTINREGRKQTI